MVALKVMKFRKTLEGTDSDHAHSGTHISSDDTGIHLPFQTETGRWETDGGLWRQAGLETARQELCPPTQVLPVAELLGIGCTSANEEGSCLSPPGFPQSSSSLLDLLPPLSCHTETLA